MNWDFIIPLNDTSLIEEFSKRANFTFPSDYKKFVKENNAGYPPKTCYDTNVTEKRCIKSLLSLNKEDEESIWDLYDADGKMEKESVPFAIDDFGNFICFNRYNGSVIFYDHETGNSEKIANNFSEFLDKLYE